MSGNADKPGLICASSGLMTDLYQLTMAAGYFQAKKQVEASFELFVRRLPENRGYLIFAGLEQALDYLRDLRFHADEVDYLRSLPAFQHVDRRFFDYLREFRFGGEVWALPEGEAAFANEPLLRVTAPIIQAQLVETYLLSTINFQTLIATKAARVVESAQGRAVVDFGARRAHGPEAGVLAARACCIGGCVGTSNVHAARILNMPPVGTMAHSFIMAFDSEEEAFHAFRQAFPETTVLLLDTYDTLEAARKVARMPGPIRGVRLDSGDLCALSKEVRRILDGAGKKDVRIVVSSDLNEYRIEKLIQDGAAIDLFGVGTEMVTSRDQPALGGVYKLVELIEGGEVEPKVKLSLEKETYPGRKQVFRQNDAQGRYAGDVIGKADEELPGKALLEPVMKKGQILKPHPPLSEVQLRAKESREKLAPEIRRLRQPADYPMHYSQALKDLLQQVLQSMNARMVPGTDL